MEFALVAGALLITCIGTVDLGILLWTQEVLELAAVETARCVALGSSLCASPQVTSPAAYAVSIAQQYSFDSALATGGYWLTASNVWVGTNVTCSSTQSNQTSGTNTVVTITNSYWASIFSALQPAAIALGADTARTATACYPG